MAKVVRTSVSCYQRSCPLILALCVCGFRFCNVPSTHSRAQCTARDICFGCGVHTGAQMIPDTRWQHRLVESLDCHGHECPPHLKRLLSPRRSASSASAAAAALAVGGLSHRSGSVALMSSSSPSGADAAPSRADRTTRFTALYLFGVGAALLLAPRSTFSLLFNPDEISTAWIRVFGSLCALLAWYYAGVVRYNTAENRGFLHATVSGRLFLAVVLTAIATVGGGGRGLLLLAATNAAGALAMRRALILDLKSSKAGIRRKPA